MGKMEKMGENGENEEKFVKLVKPKHYNSLSAAGAQAAVCLNFGGRLSYDVNSHSINFIVGDIYRSPSTAIRGCISELGLFKHTSTFGSTDPLSSTDHKFENSQSFWCR